ncbi:phage tail tape measure protein [Listeria booriae]|uniref:phage tail tape measure protein n=1 Tax=Listeria booriae TaxID=1552123 RepID=UPI0016259F4F|nr:phage tail tape measure protein [Listeria booriae]MBC1247352.1 hypothetical protein [Listeria booriae]
MGKQPESKVKFSIFNQEFTKGIKEMAVSISTLNKEFKLEQEQLKRTGTEQEKLESSLAKLGREHDIAKQKVSLTEKQLGEAKRMYGENSEEANILQRKLLDFQIAEQKVANQTGVVTDTLHTLKQAQADASSETTKYQQKMGQLKGEQDQLKSSSDRLTSEYEMQKAAMGATVSEADTYALAQKHVQQQTDITKRVIANLEQQLMETERMYGKNSVEANQMATKLNNAKASVSKLDMELEELAQGGKDSTDSMEELGKKITAGNFLHAAEILGDVAEKVIDLGKGAFESALDVDDATTRINKSLGLTGKEAARTRDVVSKIFSSGITDNYEEISEAIISVQTNMGKMADDDALGRVAQKALVFSKTFDSDVNESVRGANALMMTFKMDAGTAFDFMTVGAQNGLDKTDELGDNLAEYATLFEENGYSASDMFAILDAGLKGGAYNLDKVNDLVKEFGVRVADGTIEKAVGEMGGNFKKLFTTWKKDGGTNQQLFQLLGKEITGLSTKQQKATAISQIFGSMGEDAGTKVIESMSNVSKAYDDVSGKSDALNKKSAKQEWQESLNKIKASLIPIGQDLVDALTPVMSVIGRISDGFGKLPRPIRMAITIFTALLTVFVLLTPIIGALAITIFALDTALLPIIAIVAAVALVITGLILLIKNWGSVVEWLKAQWEAFVQWLGTLWTGIQTLASNIWCNIATFFSGLWQGIKNTALIIWQGFSNWLLGIWKGIVGFATPIWQGLVNVFTFIFLLIQSIIQGVWTVITSILMMYWNAIVSMAQTIWKPLAPFFTAFWNIIQGLFTVVWGSIKGFLVGLWTSIVAFARAIWMPLRGFFSGVWNGIRSVTVAIWNAIKSFFVSVWNAIVAYIFGKVMSIRTTVTTVWNAIRSVTTAVWNGVRSVLSGVWNSIQSLITNTVNGVRNTVSSVWNSIKGTTSAVWNGIKNAMTQPILDAKNKIKDMIDAVKGFFANIKLKFPKIDMPKLPHFSLKGKFSLDPPSVPSVGVNWYKKGGVFDGASVIGIGEDPGVKEAAIPLSGRHMVPFATKIAAIMTELRHDGGVLGATDQLVQEKVVNETQIHATFHINGTVREEADVQKIAKEVNDILGGLI